MSRFFSNEKSKVFTPFGTLNTVSCRLRLTFKLLELTTTAFCLWLALCATLYKLCWAWSVPLLIIELFNCWLWLLSCVAWCPFCPALASTISLWEIQPMISECWGSLEHEIIWPRRLSIRICSIQSLWVFQRIYSMSGDSLALSSWILGILLTHGAVFHNL